MFFLILKLIGLAFLAILIYGFPMILVGALGDTVQQRNSSKGGYFFAVGLNVLLQTYVYSIYTAILFKLSYNYINKVDTINWIIWIVVFFCNIIPIYNFYVVTSGKVKEGNPNHSVVNVDSFGFVVMTSFVIYFIFLFFPNTLTYYSWIPFI